MADNQQLTNVPQGISDPSNRKAAKRESKTCRCGEALRKGQRDCRKCHAVSMKEYRNKQRGLVQKLQDALAQLTGSNQFTRELFERQFATRDVLMVPQPGDEFPDSAGLVVGFKPAAQVSVMTPDGRFFDVPLDRLGLDTLNQGTSYG